MKMYHIGHTYTDAVRVFETCCPCIKALSSIKRSLVKENDIKPFFCEENKYVFWHGCEYESIILKYNTYWISDKINSFYSIILTFNHSTTNLQIYFEDEKIF